MPRPKGRTLALSPSRQLVTELLRVSRNVPVVTAERRMSLAEVIAARASCQPRPAWSVIFAKAFAHVAADMPPLRRTFLTFPRQRLYEHPDAVVAITVERQLDDGEAVLFARIRLPEQMPLAELDAVLRRYKSAPVASVPAFRRTLRLARIPWPIRRFLYWAGLQVSGRWRERFMGTFGLSSPASMGAGMTTLVTPMTCTLHYGLFEPTGHIDMRLTFDHRVLDGATAARGLARMEATLHGAIRDELFGMGRRSHAA